MATVTIAGFELYPEQVTPRQRNLGGPIRRALDGTGRKKVPASKAKLQLAWPSLDSDEMQVVRVVWELCRQGSVSISCSDPYVSGTYLCADEELAFDPLEGDQKLWRGVLNFEEV